MTAIRKHALNEIVAHGRIAQTCFFFNGETWQHPHECLGKQPSTATHHGSERREQECITFMTAVVPHFVTEKTTRDPDARSLIVVRHDVHCTDEDS